MDSRIKPRGISYGEPKYFAFFLSLEGQEIASSTDVQLSSSQNLPQGRVVDLVGSTASAKHNQVTITLGGDFSDVATDDAPRYLHRMYSLLISNKHSHLKVERLIPVLSCKPSPLYSLPRYGGQGIVMPEEIKLIQRAPVVRDENGMFQHPDLPDFDEGDGDKCKAWIAEQGLQVCMVSLEYADEAIANRYFESHDPDCSYWEPERPTGGDWFCLAIHDTDDGPVCWWARREVKP